MANLILIRNVCEVCHIYAVAKERKCTRCFLVFFRLREFEEMMDFFYGKLPRS